MPTFDSSVLALVSIFHNRCFVPSKTKELSSKGSSFVLLSSQVGWGVLLNFSCHPLTIQRNSWQQKQSGRKYIDTWPLFFETSLKTIEYILWNLWLKDPINSVCLSGLESSLPRLAALAAGEPGVCQSSFHQSADCKMRLIAKLSIQLADTFVLNSFQPAKCNSRFISSINTLQEFRISSLSVSGRGWSSSSHPLDSPGQRPSSWRGPDCQWPGDESAQRPPRGPGSVHVYSHQQGRLHHGQRHAWGPGGEIQNGSLEVLYWWLQRSVACFDLRVIIECQPFAEIKPNQIINNLNLKHLRERQPSKYYIIKVFPTKCHPCCHRRALWDSSQWHYNLQLFPLLH